MNRRQLLKSAALTAMTLGLDASSPQILRRRLLAAPIDGNKRMIVIFQRGGADAINSVIPRGDPEYNRRNRPTLFLTADAAIDLGNGFAQLHPALRPLLDVYNSSELTSTAGPGNLAILHRIGYANQTLSHFDGQQFWENGAPDRPYLEEGMLYRFIERHMDPASNPLVAATVASSQMLSFQGTIPFLTASQFGAHRLSDLPGDTDRFTGALPAVRGRRGGRGFLGLYGGRRTFSGKPYRDLVYGTGVALAQSIVALNEALAQGPYVPANGASYDFGEFGERMQQVAMLLKRTPVRVLGVNLPGWDTHTQQGQFRGVHGNLLQKLAGAYQALYLDLQEEWEDLLIVTMTEFGRTSVENAAGGTDHAKACAMFVGGGAVKGGVYNCDSSTWAPGDMFSADERYVSHRTDFRAVFAEIFQRHFGDDPATIEGIIPGYGAAAAENPEHFEFLDFLPA